MKQAKVYTIIQTRDYDGKKYEQTGTLQELITSFKYTLECGASYQHERGNKKINQNPKTIKSLVTNLYNAKNNSAANGYSGLNFEYVEM